MSLIPDPRQFLNGQIVEYQVGPPTQLTENGILAFICTHSAHKVQFYRQIYKVLHKHGLISSNIQFEDFLVLVGFTSAEEDGVTARDNADLKAKTALATILESRTKPDLINNLVSIKNFRGLAANAPEIFFTDDHVFHLEIDIWEELKDKIKPFVSAAIFNRANEDYKTVTDILLISKTNKELAYKLFQQSNITIKESNLQKMKDALHDFVEDKDRAQTRTNVKKLAQSVGIQLDFDKILYGGPGSALGDIVNAMSVQLFHKKTVEAVKKVKGEDNKDPIRILDESAISIIIPQRVKNTAEGQELVYETIRITSHQQMFILPDVRFRTGRLLSLLNAYTLNGVNAIFSGDKLSVIQDILNHTWAGIIKQLDERMPEILRKLAQGEAPVTTEFKAAAPVAQELIVRNFDYSKPDAPLAPYDTSKLSPEARKIEKYARFLYVDHSAHAYTFGPMPKTPKEKIRAIYELISVVSTKKYHADRIHTQIAIINDGTWNQFLPLLKYLSTRGVSRNFNNYPGMEPSEPLRQRRFGVQVRKGHEKDRHLINLDATDAFDIWQAQNVDLKKSGVMHQIQEHIRRRLVEKAQQYPILLKKRNGIHTNGHSNGSVSAPIFRPLSELSEFEHNGPAVALWSTASNEHEITIQGKRRLGEWVKAHNGVVIQGAFNRGAGRGLEGINGLKVFGVTILELLKVEAERNQFPSFVTHPHLCPDIYVRLAHFFQANNLMCLAGGEGSLQEIIAFIMLKMEFPEDFEDKSLIVVNDDLYEDKEKRFWFMLNSAIKDLKNCKTIEELGIYIVKNTEEAMKKAELIMDINPDTVDYTTGKVRFHQPTVH